MREIVPYRTKGDALAALDNGGEFFNFFTKANDGVITEAELAKVAGPFLDEQMLFLYLDMVLAELSDEEAKDVISILSPELKAAHKYSAPSRMTASFARLHGRPARSAIVTGVPRLVDSINRWDGFFIMMIPTTDRYDVYEVRDQETGDDFMFAHVRGRNLRETPTRLGGLIEVLKHKKDAESHDVLCLKTLFYSEI